MAIHTTSNITITKGDHDLATATVYCRVEKIRDVVLHFNITYYFNFNKEGGKLHLSETPFIFANFFINFFLFCFNVKIFALFYLR
jgi:hypothetical protein